MRQQPSKLLCLLLCDKVKTIDVLVRHFQLVKKHTHANDGENAEEPPPTYFDSPMLQWSDSHWTGWVLFKRLEYANVEAFWVCFSGLTVKGLLRQFN